MTYVLSNSEYRIQLMNPHSDQRSRATGSPADPARALHVDRRFRALPLGGEAAEGALSRAARSMCSTTTLCAPLRRLHAGLRTGDRRRPAAQAAGLRRASRRWRSGCGREGYGTALVMPRTWKAALAPFLAGIPERIGFRRRGALRPAQRSALGRAQAAAHDRSLRRAGAARRGGSRPPTGRCRS